MTTGRWLIRKDKYDRAHIWIGDDTLCRMYSGGSFNKKRMTVTDDTGGRAVCAMCAARADAANELGLPMIAQAATNTNSVTAAPVLDWGKIISRAQSITGYLNNCEERQRWHGMLTFIAIERGYQPGWSAHKFKERFGFYPSSMRLSALPIEPSPKVRSWVRSRLIAYAKTQQKASSVT